MKQGTLREYKERLLHVLVHIQERLDEPLSLAWLSGLASLAPHHFHHVFTGMMGESLGVFRDVFEFAREQRARGIDHGPIRAFGTCGRGVEVEQKKVL